MNADFLKAVQAAGWTIESADGSVCIVTCPTPGCGMRARFRQDGAVPQRDVPFLRYDEPVTTFSEAQEVLRRRRQNLGLTIPEVEDIAGMAGDHLAKFERVDYSRPPGIEIFLEWCGALGMEVVLRHGDLPPVALRVIADTRSRAKARQRRFELERQRDADERRHGRART